MKPLAATSPEKKGFIASLWVPPASELPWLLRIVPGTDREQPLADPPVRSPDEAFHVEHFAHRLSRVVATCAACPSPSHAGW
ncbi:MAG: hypothetical protein R3D25_07220 [Geminicoccaceae bacterium]